MVGRDAGRGGKNSLLTAGIHRLHRRLNECDLLRRQSVALIKPLVRPGTVERDIWDERVDILRSVLRWLAERYQKPDETGSQILRVRPGGLLIRKPTRDDIRLRACLIGPVHDKESEFRRDRSSGCERHRSEEHTS